VAASRTPIVVGVGHERDTTLAELAADVRASTPSNAAELVVQSREEVALEVGQMRQQLRYVVQDRITKYSATTKRLLDILKGQVRTLDHGLKQLVRILNSLSPSRVLNRGYTITKNAKGVVIKQKSQVEKGDLVKTQLAKGTIESLVQ